MSQCPKNCVYGYKTSSETGCLYCQYILVTGHRRPCPPGQDCTVYERGKRKTPKVVASSPRKPERKSERRPRPHPTHEERKAQAALLFRRRKEAGLSQPAAAKKIGVGTATYKAWEYGRNGAKWERLETVFPGVTEEWQAGRGVHEPT